MNERKPYERPAVILEKSLEGLAGDCGAGDNNIYLGDLNCKGEGLCAVLLS
jgi:hypothetical protein